MTTQKHEATLGTVCHGSHRYQDVIPALLGELEYLDSDRHAKYLSDIAGEALEHLLAVDDILEPDDETTDSRMDWLSGVSADLFDILDVMSPDYCYFGAHEGDGADFGFWPSWDAIDDAIHDGERMVKSDDCPDAKPADGVCYHLHVNDHGNATLYAWNGSEWAEIWAIV